jgi:hypothetical protein
VEHHRLAVGAELHVALDGVAARHRRLGRGQRVLRDDGGAVVQAAMGDRTGNDLDAAVEVEAMFEVA